MATIGQVIRDVRKRKGLTQADLAKAAGVSTMSVRRYENGERNIPEEVLRRIANVLDYSFDDLLTLEDAMEVIKRTLGADSFDLIKKFGPPENVTEKQAATDTKATETHTHWAEAFNWKDESTWDEWLFDTYHHELNFAGKRKVVEYAALLAANDNFKRKHTDNTTETPPEAPEDAEQGKPSNQQEKPPEGQINPKDGE